MTTTEIKSQVETAISRSQSHTEPTTIEAATHDEALLIISQAKRQAEESGLEFGSTDTNHGYECWAGEPDSDKMEWRIKIPIALSSEE